MAKLVQYIAYALLGVLVGIGIRSWQDAKKWGMNFWEVYQDRIMRILGWW